jgi:hypothetical protein
MRIFQRISGAILNVDPVSSHHKSTPDLNRDMIGTDYVLQILEVFF